MPLVSAVLSTLLAATVALPPQSPAADAALDIAFPLRLEAPLAESGWLYEPLPDALAALAACERGTLRECVLPTRDGLASFDLVLRRLPAATTPLLLRIDGVESSSARPLAAFVGAVAGEPESNVFLALTDSGLRGWVERASGRIELDALPSASGDWSHWRVLALDADSAAAARPGPAWACATPAPPQPIPLPLPVPPTPTPAPTSASSGGAATSPWPGAQYATGPLKCKLALETDFQFFEHFNDLGAAEDYARTLTSAVSSRLWSQAQIVLELSYLGLYSTSNDPWSVPDVGGDMLGEFTSAWQGTLPNGANLAHFVSGGIYSGGVAYVDVLCNASWGFGVSTGITGSTPFPVVPSWMTWDFFVLAHELGHQFGSWHTHDYCPAVDSCAAGPCVSQVACSDQGTIMSYCHGCGAGMANITTWYHPTNAQIIRQEAEASCLAPYACLDCACPWPSIAFVTPFSVAPYTPGGQTVNVSGCHFDELTELRIDGVALPSGAWQLASANSLSFQMPLVSKVGPVDLEIVSGWGKQLVWIWVTPTPAPVLGFTYVNEALQVWLTSIGTQYTVGGTPADLVFVLGSLSGQPTVVPGLVSLGIGDQLASLYVMKSFALGNSAWSTHALPMNASLAGLVLYFQAAALRNGALPLLSSNVASGYVMF
jgi:hypothetical protein